MLAVQARSISLTRSASSARRFRSNSECFVIVPRFVRHADIRGHQSEQGTRFRAELAGHYRGRIHRTGRECRRRAVSLGLFGRSNPHSRRRRHDLPRPARSAHSRAGRRRRGSPGDRGRDPCRWPRQGVDHRARRSGRHGDHRVAVTLDGSTTTTRLANGGGAPGPGASPDPAIAAARDSWLGSWIHRKHGARPGHRRRRWPRPDLSCTSRRALPSRTGRSLRHRWHGRSPRRSPGSACLPSPIAESPACARALSWGKTWRSSRRFSLVPRR
jgi:hypothetical protein